MISYETIRDFIIAQPDDRKVNMMDGKGVNYSGCVLVHYAQAHNIPLPDNGVGFHFVGDQELHPDASHLLYRGTFSQGESIARCEETYGIIKERMQRLTDFPL